MWHIDADDETFTMTTKYHPLRVLLVDFDLRVDAGSERGIKCTTRSVL